MAFQKCLLEDMLFISALLIFTESIVNHNSGKQAKETNESAGPNFYQNHYHYHVNELKCFTLFY